MKLIFQYLHSQTESRFQPHEAVGKVTTAILIPPMIRCTQIYVNVTSSRHTYVMNASWVCKLFRTAGKKSVVPLGTKVSRVVLASGFV